MEVCLPLCECLAFGLVKAYDFLQKKAVYRLGAVGEPVIIAFKLKHLGCEEIVS
jgi:hypothetical protein